MKRLNFLGGIVKTTKIWAGIPRFLLCFIIMAFISANAVYAAEKTAANHDMPTAKVTLTAVKKLDGTTLPGFKMTLQQTSGLLPLMHLYKNTLTTDSGGKAVFEDVPLGHYTVSLADSWGLEESIHDVEIFAVGKNETLKFDFRPLKIVFGLEYNSYTSPCMVTIGKVTRSYGPFYSDGGGKAHYDGGYITGSVNVTPNFKLGNRSFSIDQAASHHKPPYRKIKDHHFLWVLLKLNAISYGKSDYFASYDMDDLFEQSYDGV